MFPLLKKVLVFLFLLILIKPSLALAQVPTPIQSVQGAATLGVAHYVEVKDIKKVKDAMVISTSTLGAIPSIVPYDSQVIGVISFDAAILINTNGSSKTVPIISDGNVYILVSSQQGNIKKGDLLATSSIPGVAVKATKSGYVLGTSLEDYSASDPKKIDKIAVALNLHYVNSKPIFPGNLSDLFNGVLLPTANGPSPIFKDLVAAAVVMGSLILGFLSFGRTAAKGVEALGRNPAASRIIHLGIIFNVGIVVAISLAGLIVAILILRL